MIFTKTKYLGMAMTLACSTALAQHKSPTEDQCRQVEPLDYFVNLENTRNENMALAYLSGHYTLEQVGSHLAVFTRRLVGL